MECLLLACGVVIELTVQLGFAELCCQSVLCVAYIEIGPAADICDLQQGVADDIEPVVPERERGRYGTGVIMESRFPQPVDMYTADHLRAD